MLRKRYIIIGIIISLIIAVIAIISLITAQNREVKFTLSYPGVHADITDTSHNKIASVQDGSILKLQDKTYYLNFTGDKFNQDPIGFKVTKDTKTLTFDPSFSKAELTKLLKQEHTAIDAVVRASIKTNKQYVTDGPQLYHQGEWYTISARVYQDVSADPDIGNPDSVDIYYLVLKKENGAWKKMAGPSLVITKPDNPSIPTYVIDAINPAEPPQ
jgi:hypothetical protein